MPLPFPILLVLAAPAPDLEAKVKAIFEENTCTGCHSAGGEEPNLEGSPARLVGMKSKATGKPYVVAGNPDGSYLMAKLIGKGIEGDPMPLGGDPLPAGQKKTVSEWIASLGKAAAVPTPPPSTGGGGGAAAGGDLDKKIADAEARVQKIFNDQCAACHDKGADEVVLTGPLERLTRERSKVNQKPFIVAGDPDGSYLLQKMTGAKGIQGDVMPLGGDPLPKADLEAVRTYITLLGERGKAGPAAPTDAPPGDTTPPPGDTTPPPDDGAAEPPGDEKKPSKPPFHGVWQINLPSTTSLGRRNFEFRIDHRFGRVGEERGAFGLDAGAIISYGFAYGILDGWDVVLRRTSSRKGYEFGTKYIPIRQEAGKPVSFGGYASVEYFRDFPSSTANPWSGNFQLLLSRLWFDRWSTMLVLGYSLRTDHQAAPQVDLPDDGVDGPVAVRDRRGTLGVGIGSTVWLGQKKKWGIDMEYNLPIPADAFFYNGGNADPAGSNIGSWSIGGSIRTGLHFFQIFITNTREIHTNLYAPGGQSKNPFADRGSFFFGFNLSRKWGL